MQTAPDDSADIVTVEMLSNYAILCASDWGEDHMDLRRIQHEIETMLRVVKRMREAAK